MPAQIVVMCIAGVGMQMVNWDWAMIKAEENLNLYPMLSLRMYILIRCGLC